MEKREPWGARQGVESHRRQATSLVPGKFSTKLSYSGLLILTSPFIREGWGKRLPWTEPLQPAWKKPPQEGESESCPIQRLGPCWTPEAPIYGFPSPRPSHPWP